MNQHLLSLALIPILGILGQWIAWRIRFPSIVILLFLGFLVGPISGVLNTDLVFGDLLYPLVSLLVAVIVFEGGLNLKIVDLKGIGTSVFRLVFIAPIITIGLMYACTHYILGLSTEISLMFSALMVITGPTVIIPLLRHIKVNPKTSSLIRWEGILIAPIGTILIVLVYQSMFISTEHLFKTTALILIKTIGVSLITSLTSAIIMIICFKRNWVPDFLQELITLVIVFSTFILSNTLQADSGILTVVLLGIILANQREISLQHIKVFKENLRILAISTLFIILSSRLIFSDLQTLFDLKHGLYLLSLIFIVRPIATFISLIRSSLSFKERTLMAWIAPRGIVTASIASLFALRLVNKGIPGAETLVPLTFLVLIFTVVVYGFTLNPFIKGLKIEENEKRSILIVGANEIAVAIAKLLNKITDIQVSIVDSNRKRVQYARLDGIKALHSSVFSNRISEDMQLGAHNYMVALTENDEVNTLSCIQYSEIIGAENVFRLPPTTLNSSQTEGFKKIDAGQLITNTNFGFAFLKQVFLNNDSFRTITLISDISMDEFKAVYGDHCVPILGISPNKTIITATQLTEFNKDEQWIIIDSAHKITKKTA
jgi:NhaP-type Na+/H+ or K+/H+ antiporter